jgi:predicted transcriptional regulator of viral defense system
MKVNEWMDFFRDHTIKKIFSLSDIKVLTGENTSTISVQLSRLSRNGIVENPIKGWYTNPFNLPNSEELSMVLRAPCYLSMEYALSRHGILSQDVHTYTLITTKLPHTYHGDDDIFEYHQMKRSLFWGYTSEGTVQVAEPEKALLDLIYVRITRNRFSKEEAVLSLIDDMYLEDLDGKKALDLSNRFDRKTKEFTAKIFNT